MSPDRKKFPCISLAYRAIEMGGTAPAVLNAVDEVAVQAFLNRKIPFSDIPKLIAATLEAHDLKQADHLEAIIEADAWARKHACNMLELEEGLWRDKHVQSECKPDRAQPGI